MDLFSWRYTASSELHSLHNVSVELFINNCNELFIKLLHYQPPSLKFKVKVKDKGTYKIIFGTKLVIKL